MGLIRVSQNIILYPTGKFHISILEKIPLNSRQLVAIHMNMHIYDNHDDDNDDIHCLKWSSRAERAQLVSR